MPVRFLSMLLAALRQKTWHLSVMQGPQAVV